jgi:cell division transport system permease protein
MRALRYAFDEAIASLWRGRRSAFLSATTIAVALFVLGAFLLVTSNLERLSAEWSRAAELSVYLDEEATPGDREAVERLLAPGPVVASFAFVSKEEALTRFRETFADIAAASATLGANPLPASYEVRLQASEAARDTVEALATELAASPGVADVRYDRQWLTRLLSVVTAIRGIGLALGAVLTVAAALTVANVVRLALHARRDEIEIMQLVGAPRAFIRGPFVMEGVLQGGLGALVALAALAAVFLGARARYLAPLAGDLNLSPVGFLSPELCLMLVLGGMVVGCLGGLVAAMGRTA